MTINEMIRQQNDSEHNDSEINRMFPEILECEVDMIEPNKVVTKSHIFWIIFPIFTYVIGVILDLHLVAKYLLAGHYGHFAFTKLILIIPSLINVIVSDRMYQQDSEMETNCSENYTCSRRKVISKSYWPFIIFFQLALILRYCDALKYAILSYRHDKRGDRIGQRKFYVMLIKEKQDISLLNVFECFLKAAPQQVFYLSLITQSYKIDQIISSTSLHQIIMIGKSLVVLGWAMSSYNETIRIAQEDKTNFKTSEFTFQFFWHFFITVSRIVAISTAIAMCGIYAACVCIIHWLIMTLWIMNDPSGIVHFCQDQRKPPHIKPKIRERIRTYLFCMVYGVIFFFIYLKPAEGSTFIKHCIYYGVCATENIIASAVWIIFRCCVFYEWDYVLMALSIFAFMVGVIFMIIYYRYFHPSIINRNSYESSNTN